MEKRNKIIFAGAAGAVVLVGSVGACGTTTTVVKVPAPAITETVAAKPAPVKVKASAKAPVKAKPATTGVGTTFKVTGMDDNGNPMSYAVKLDQVQSPTALGAYEQQASAHYAVGAEFTVTGVSVKRLDHGRVLHADRLALKRHGGLSKTLRVCDRDLTYGERPRSIRNELTMSLTCSRGFGSSLSLFSTAARYIVSTRFIASAGS